MPEINIPSLSVLDVSFWTIRYYPGNSERFSIIVGVMTDPDVKGSFVPVDTIDVTDFYEHIECNVSLENYKGNGKYIAFMSDFAESNLFVIDNIVVDYRPEVSKVSYKLGIPAANSFKFDFDREYDCDECGRHFSVDKMNEILSEYIKEYDLEIDESNDPKEDEEIAERNELELSGKKVVTTGLSIEDERWVQEQVESRGGEYKPKFVVSLDYLIYNPDYDHETVKYTKAKEQIEKGKPVQIITFDDFKRSLL
jgi:NAD-dependent DNA ligase